ncbi:MAG: glycosyltransferase family 2 protein [Acidobacteria bacterium]|nr:glycosyltransferase family 2 protein [Acidobacteriota bacterium]
MKLSVIVPVYNEESTIEEVIGRVLAVDLGPIDKEVIISNDGSTDGTQATITRSVWARDPRVKAHHSPINLGKGAAVRFGLHHAAGDILLIQDADLELDPQEYGSLLAPILRGDANVVYGSRFLGRSNVISLRTRAANRFLTWLTNLLFGARLTDMETAYKVFRRPAIENVRLRCVGFDFEPEITARLLRAGERIVEVPVRYQPRRVEQGKKIGLRDGFDAIYALLKCRFERPTPSP